MHVPTIYFTAIPLFDVVWFNIAITWPGHAYDPLWQLSNESWSVKTRRNTNWYIFCLLFLRCSVPRVSLTPTAVSDIVYFLSGYSFC